MAKARIQGEQKANNGSVYRAVLKKTAPRLNTVQAGE
jgi:hypothetical protein